MSRSEKITNLYLDLITMEHRRLENTRQYKMTFYEIERLQEEGAIGALLGVMAVLVAVPLLPVTMFILCMFDCGLNNYFRLLKQGYTRLYELGVVINK